MFKKIIATMALAAASTSAFAGVVADGNLQQLNMAAQAVLEVIDDRPAGAPVWGRADWRQWDAERSNVLSAIGETDKHLPRLVGTINARIDQLMGSDVCFTPDIQFSTAVQPIFNPHSPTLLPYFADGQSQGVTTLSRVVSDYYNATNNLPDFCYTPEKNEEIRQQALRVSTQINYIYDTIIPALTAARDASSHAGVIAELNGEIAQWNNG